MRTTVWLGVVAFILHTTNVVPTGVANMLLMILFTLCFVQDIRELIR